MKVKQQVEVPGDEESGRVEWEQLSVEELECVVGGRTRLDFTQGSVVLFKLGLANPLSLTRNDVYLENDGTYSVFNRASRVGTKYEMVEVDGETYWEGTATVRLDDGN